MGDGTATPHEVIARFKERLRTFPGTSRCTLVFPNKWGHREVVWAVYAALSKAPPLTRKYSGYPAVELQCTEWGDGVLTESVQIGNYGPPETRNWYSLRVGDEACVWTCDDNDFDLVTKEASFRVSARAPEVLEHIVNVIVDWHARRDAPLSRREESPS